jgi:hypothetical protein
VLTFKLYSPSVVLASRLDTDPYMCVMLHFIYYTLLFEVECDFLGDLAKAPCLTPGDAP